MKIFALAVVATASLAFFSFAPLSKTDNGLTKVVIADAKHAATKVTGTATCYEYYETFTTFSKCYKNTTVGSQLQASIKQTEDLLAKH